MPIVVTCVACYSVVIRLTKADAIDAVVAADITSQSAGSGIKEVDAMLAVAAAGVIVHCVGIGVLDVDAILVVVAGVIGHSARDGRSKADAMGVAAASVGG